MSNIHPSQSQGSKAKPSTLFLSNFGFLPSQDASWSRCQWPLSLAGLRSRTGHSADHQHSGRIYCVLVVGEMWGRTTKPEAFKENACTKFGYLYVSICMRCLVHLHTKIAVNSGLRKSHDSSCLILLIEEILHHLGCIKPLQIMGETTNLNCG